MTPHDGERQPPEERPPRHRLHCHLLLCATPSKALCQADPAVGAASWERLKGLIRELGLDDPQRPEGVVWRSKVDCLRVCHDGPVLLIWPDGSLYGGVGPERIEQIVRRHVIGGEPVQEWILERCSLAACSSAAPRAEARVSRSRPAERRQAEASESPSGPRPQTLRAEPGS